MASPTGTARMPTQGSWRPLVMISVSAPLRSTVRREDRGCRLHREARHHRLAGGDAAQNAAGMIGQEADALIAHPHLVGVFLARQFGRAKGSADIDAIH